MLVSLDIYYSALCTTNYYYVIIKKIRSTHFWLTDFTSVSCIHTVADRYTHTWVPANNHIMSDLAIDTLRIFSLKKLVNALSCPETEGVSLAVVPDRETVLVGIGR